MMLECSFPSGTSSSTFGPRLMGSDITNYSTRKLLSSGVAQTCVDIFGEIALNTLCSSIGS